MNKKKKIRIIFIIIILLLLGIVSWFTIIKDKNVSKKEPKNEMIYIEYARTINDGPLYNEMGEEVGFLTKDIYLELENNDDKKTNNLIKIENQNYFKIKNLPLYIKYNNVKKNSYDEETSTRYKNYVPFEESISTNKNTKLYIDEDRYYIINNNMVLPIIKKDNDKYYAIFDNKLVYSYISETSIVENYISIEKATSIAVLNYHFTISFEEGEDKICDPIDICLRDTEFDNHIKYISDNYFYTITMEELELFIDGKINLPKKSVAITFDDGWFISRAKTILEKYNVMGTLFLIGSLAPVSDYSSSNLEIHSHTWDLHSVSNCSEGRSALLCYDNEEIVEDLLKSRESLNNTTYFCYPFYDYNDHAISAIKEAGFTMALTGGNKKVKIGIDKYKVPRYVVYNTTTVSDIKDIIN